MSWARKNLGMDWFNLFIYTGVTTMMMAFVGISNGPEELFPVITGLALLTLGIHRSIVLRADRLRGGLPDDLASARLNELEERVAMLEATEARVADLEERLDFAERMLAQAREPDRIGRGTP